MMVLKRKEIVASALVVLIGVAGYLNWSYQDVMKVTDGDEYIATGKKLGEAQLVNKTDTDTTDSDNYFDDARENRETSREKALDILNQTASNESFDAEARKKAQDAILDIASAVEHEAAIENTIKAKGYEMASVYIDGNNVEILVKKDGITDNDVQKLSEIATSHLGISASNVKIIPVK
ncbi:MAG: SpoIIIAH-like family protein [Clostridia bacterium]|nr:SpoIIIAH-like family protein [Clostridia bacterium]